MARQRLIRGEASLPDEATLVRALFDTYPDGAAFNRDVLVADVSYNFDEFGYYGLSLWAVSDPWPLNRVLGEKTRKARRIALFSAGALRAQGLGLVPSGRPPHHDTALGPVYGETFGSVQATAASADELVHRFLRAAYTVEENQYYEQDPG